jgi:uncharacterized membrane protein YeaQ/YmgE (transglycosylase-associated protein family)
MDLLLWIVFGALVGIAASALMKSSNGLILDTLLGIVGAFLGGWIMSFFNKSGVTGFNLYSFLVALLGAVILIAIVRGIRH